MAKIEIFQIHIEYSSTTIWVKISVKITLSLTVSEILTFLGFPQKSKMAAKSGEKIEIFQFCIGYFAITLRVKSSVKITLSLAVSEILTFSVFPQKSKMATKSGEIEIFQFHIEYSLHTLWVKNSVEIALSLTVSEILTFFVFPQKFKMAAKSGDPTTLWVKNSVQIALSLTVSEILRFFRFSAKIQDGGQKW